MTPHVQVLLFRFIQMFAVWCVLLAWRWLADRLGCIGSTLILIPLWGALTLSASEVALFKRYAFIAHYLSPEGILARLLRRKTMLLLWQSIKALFFCLILIISALSFDMNQWLVLLADVIVMATLVGIFDWLLHGEVKPGYRAPFAHYWAHWVNTVLLWLVSVLVIFYSAHENYLGLSWEEVVHFSASKVTVACDALAVLARINAVSEALVWWAAQNLLVGWERPAQQLLAWFAFIASFGVSFLIAWAYSRALAGVLSRPWRFVVSHRVSNQE